MLFSSAKPKKHTCSEITNKAVLILYNMDVSLPQLCWPNKVLKQKAEKVKKYVVKADKKTSQIL